MRGTKIPERLDQWYCLNLWLMHEFLPCGSFICCLVATYFVMTACELKDQAPPKSRCHPFSNREGAQRAGNFLPPFQISRFFQESSTMLSIESVLTLLLIKQDSSL